MKKMKKLLLLITLVAGVIAFALPAQATTFEINLYSPIWEDSFTLKPEPDTSPNPAKAWLTAVFNDDTGSDTSVFLTLTANLGINTLTPPEPNFVGSWYFNINPDFVFDATNYLTITVDGSHTAPEADTIVTGNSTEKADGDGYFDIEFAFPTSAPNFDNSESIKYLIASSSDVIDAKSFNFGSVTSSGGSTISATNSWTSVAHIQTISDEEGSTWIGGKGGLVEEGDPVPEPATMLLLGSGLIGIAFGGKKRFKKTNE